MRRFSRMRFKKIQGRRPRLRPKPIPRSVVPSFFTLMNAFCGFLAILQIFQNELIYASWLILLAGFFDAVDGFMARVTNGTSDFGVELDSLSDIVSFGVAPGVLMYVYVLNELSIIGMILAALPTMAGAVRLARFNVMTHSQGSTSHFMGLPIPAQAGTLVGFYMIFGYQPEFFNGIQYGVRGVVISLLVLLCLLMVSMVPFDKIPRFNREFIRRHPWKTLLFVLYGLLIILGKETGVVLVFTIFIGKGIGIYAARLFMILFGIEDTFKA